MKESLKTSVTNLVIMSDEFVGFFIKSERYFYI